MLTGVQASAVGLYLPAVFPIPPKRVPPQIIISFPVQTAVWENRAEGALVVLVAVQISVPGLYLPPELNKPEDDKPPHTIISLPVQTAV